MFWILPWLNPYLRPYNGSHACHDPAWSWKLSPSLGVLLTHNLIVARCGTHDNLDLPSGVCSQHPNRAWTCRPNIGRGDKNPSSFYLGTSHRAECVKKLRPKSPTPPITGDRIANRIVCHKALPMYAAAIGLLSGNSIMISFQFS